MSEIVLKLEGVSKQYRIGQLGTGTISHDLNRFIARMRGKSDPYLKVGDLNDKSSVGSSEYVWSLKNISFDVNRGEVLGIIGKNGAGKSTLLKILSQVTTPTLGTLKIKGRVAALLEVGTGFHPELTGRENIYLNGAILGMTKSEITSRIDEIISFSGIAKYIDTPVKRYSSGMTVRLGFAVAAHLEPEILIVDEVLAVGDAEFQNKCIGKMKDVSGEGRTVLFVSHNMAAVKSLCTRCILLDKGQVEENADVSTVLSRYSSGISVRHRTEFDNETKRSGLGEVKFTAASIDADMDRIESGKAVRISVNYAVKVLDPTATYEFVVGVWNNLGMSMFMLTNRYLDHRLNLSESGGVVNFNIDRLALNSGIYTVNLLIIKNGLYLDFIEGAFSFKVEAGDFFGSRQGYPEGYEGFYQSFNISHE